MNDWDLIQRWTHHHDDDAFDQLVRRHLPFVFACARRQIGAAQASDVTQSVFLILARKAGSFRSDIVLSSWLFRTTGFVVAQARRRETRRSRLEAEAIPMISPSSDATPDEAWREPLEAHLDEALAALSETDRRYVLTRFFERRRFADVAECFGVSEDAAKKRVGRALERMRLYLVGRGVAIPATTLSALLLRPRAEALPAQLPSAILRSVRPTGAGTGATAPGRITELADAALRQGAAEGLRIATLRTLAWLTGIALVVTVGSFVRPAARTSAPPDSPPAALPPEAARLALATPSEPDPNAPRKELVLWLRDAVTDRPLAGAEIRAVQTFADAEPLELTVTTDAEGQGIVPLGRRPFLAVGTKLSLPGYVVTELGWRGYEFIGDTLSYTCRVLPGTRLTGEVRELGGGPVPEARVSVRGETGYEDGAREHSFQGLELVTDAEGRFESDQVALPRVDIRNLTAGRRLSLHVIHPEYAIAWAELPPDTEASPHVVITLNRGNILAGRVLDPSGAPVAGAVVRESGMADADRQAISAASGEFQLTRIGSIPSFAEVPGQMSRSFRFDVEARGYRPYQGHFVAFGTGDVHVLSLPRPETQPVRIELLPAPSSHLGQPIVRASVDVVLTPGDASSFDDDTTPGGPPIPNPRLPGPIRLRGSVLDDVTGAPIPRFRIASKFPGNGFRHLVGEGFDGTFDWSLPDANGLAFEPPAEVFAQNGFSWPPPETLTFRLGLEAMAEGYLPSEISAEWKQGVAAPLEFRLRNSAELTGWIELPNTRPALGALIGMGGEGTTFVRDAQGHLRWRSESAYSARSETEGRFRLRCSPAADRLQVIHPEGCALFPLLAAVDTIIRLEPWASVEGEARTADGQPLPATRIRLRAENPPAPARPRGFEFDYETRSDEQGRFRFAQVPPGRVVASAHGPDGETWAEARDGAVRGTVLRLRLEPK